MTDGQHSNGIGALASLKENLLHKSQFTDQTFTDAAAVMALRHRIDELMPRNENYSPNWRIPQPLPLLELINTFIIDTMSEPIKNEDGEVEGYVTHPASVLIEQFILALHDLKNGISNDHLKGSANISGHSLRSLDVEAIQHGMFLVDMYRTAGKLTLDEALDLAARRLKEAGMKVRKREMTADRLREWAKDFDHQGRKVKGK